MSEFRNVLPALKVARLFQLENKINADIVMMRDRLNGVVQLFGMAARTRRVIRQNMSWALLYNFGAIPAASMGLVAPLNSPNS